MAHADAPGSPAPPHPFTGRARWVVAAVLLIGPVLQAVEFLIVPAPPADASARVAMWSENQNAAGVSIAAGLLAVPFLIGGFAAMASLSLRDSRRLAWAALALLTVGMVGLAAIHGVLVAAYGFQVGGDDAAAIGVLEEGYRSLPGIVVVATFLLGSALGILVLVAALWRSRFVPRVVPVLVLGFFVLDLLLSLNVIGHLVSLAAFGVVAWAVVTRYERRARVRTVGHE